MKKLYFITALTAITAAIIFSTGCETKSASEKVTITPESALLEINQSVILTAAGGFEYAWSLSDETWGFLSSRSGSQTVYTSLYNPGVDSLPQVQTVQVTSTISGASGGTNGAEFATIGEALIKHLGTEE